MSLSLNTAIVSAFGISTSSVFPSEADGLYSFIVVTPCMIVKHGLLADSLLAL